MWSTTPTWNRKNDAKIYQKKHTKISQEFRASFFGFICISCRIFCFFCLPCSCSSVMLLCHKNVKFLPYVRTISSLSFSPFFVCILVSFCWNSQVFSFRSSLHCVNVFPSVTRIWTKLLISIFFLFHSSPLATRKFLREIKFSEQKAKKLF